LPERTTGSQKRGGQYSIKDDFFHVWFSFASRAI
jgi:hypothetical protein